MHSNEACFSERVLWRTLVVLLCGAASAWGAVTPRPAWPLQIKTEQVVPGVRRAYLVDSQGIPFFYSADTCWFLTFEAGDETWSPISRTELPRELR